MNHKKILITIGICGALALGGRAKDSPSEQPKEPETTDIIADVENVEDIQGETEEQEERVSHRDPMSAKVFNLPQIEKEGIRMSTPRIDREDDNITFIFYEGLNKDDYEEYKKTLEDAGFKDWIKVSEEDGKLIEKSTAEDQELTLIFVNFGDMLELEVRLLDGLER